MITDPHTEATLAPLLGLPLDRDHVPSPTRLVGWLTQTKIKAEPRLLKGDEDLLAEFEGVLAMRRPSPKAPYLVMVKPTDRPTIAQKRHMLENRTSLYWLVWGELALAGDPPAPDIRSLSLATLPWPDGRASALTSLVLRALPVAELTTIVVQEIEAMLAWERFTESHLRHQGLDVPPAREHAQRALAETTARARAASGAGRRGPKPKPREFYEEIERLRCEIIAGGQRRGIAKEIARRRHVSEKTATRWLATARDLLRGSDSKGDENDG
jgi:hypothetical protein